MVVLVRDLVPRIHKVTEEISGRLIFQVVRVVMACKTAGAVAELQPQRLDHDAVLQLFQSPRGLCP